MTLVMHWRIAFQIFASTVLLLMLYGVGWVMAALTFETPLGLGIGAVGVLLVGALCLLQYRGAFLHDLQSLKLLSIALVVVGGWCSLLSLATLIKLLSAKRLPGLDELSSLGLGPTLLVVAAVNYVWAKHGLAQPAPSQPISLQPRFNLLHIMLTVGAVSLVAFGYVNRVKSEPVWYAAHISPVDAGLVLPQGANDVCVYRGWHDYLFYNFAIDEKGFHDWASALDHAMPRPPRTLQRIVGEHKILTSSDDASSLTYHVIQQGWFYDGSHERPSIEYAFDEEAGRAYYSGRDYR